MGWFGGQRRSDGSEDGLYRGDAPVYQPGAGDDAPRAYQAGRPAPAWPADPAPASAPPPRPAFAPIPPGTGVASPARRRGPGAGCGLVALIVILVTVGAIVVAVLAVVGAVRSSIPGRDAPATQVGAVDVPVTVQVDDAQLRVSVSGVQSQPGSGWDHPDDAPTLLVAMTIQRVDDGSSSVHVPFFDWSFVPADGAAPADVDIISGFEPDLTSVSLTAGQSVGGYLAFDTAATTGQLRLAGNRYGDPPLATWELTAAPAVAVTGAAGQPVTARIGRPAFTVTLTGVGWVDQAQAGASRPPASGTFLAADFTITGTGTDTSQWVQDSSFVFVPAGGDPIGVPPPNVVSSAASFASVSAGTSAPVRAFFDAAPGPGAVELRDSAGRTMISWPIA